MKAYRIAILYRYLLENTCKGHTVNADNIVRVARVERSWMQARLAERLHTTTRTVSKIERGQTNISLDTIRAYACELDLSLNDLIRDASPDRIPYCVARYFAGMSDGQAMKYIKLCMDADSLREE